MEDADWYKSILNSMRDMVLVKGPNSALLWANKSFLDCYGMTTEELKNIVDGPQSDPDDTLQYVKDDNWVFETGEDLNIPSEPVTNSRGDIEYFHTVKSPIFENGEIVRSVGVSRPIEDADIIQQKISELDVKVFTAPLRSIIDTFPIETMLLDKNMRVIKCNEKWIQKFGSIPENTSETFSSYLPALSPIAVVVEQALARKSDVEEVIEIAADDQHQHFNFKVSPWHYPDGTIGGTIVVATDITSIVMKDREAGVLAQRLVLALGASDMGVWELDLETRELWWDDRMFELYGIAEKDFASALDTWTKALHPDDEERAPRLIREAVNDAKKLDVEFKILWPSGELRNIRAIADVVEDNTGKPLKMVGIGWDITEEKNNERSLKAVNVDLERANAELLQFSYRSSHDLKGPLTTIRGLSEFMLEDLEAGDYEEVKQNIQAIGQQAGSLETLVSDLLGLAKADFVVEAKEPIDFAAICEEVVGLNAQTADEKQVKINTNLELESEWQLPRARIFQVINNLISNGIKYADVNKSQSHVELDITDSSDELVFTVKDNGIGIPCEKKEEVFDMFKRFHGKDVSGSGIGMYIVKKHLDIMNGEIDFDTSSEGTSFRVKLKRHGL